DSRARKSRHSGVFNLSRGALTIAAVVMLAGACGGSAPPAVGTERAHCYPNDSCNTGLTCLSGFCVLVEADGAAPQGDASLPDAGEVSEVGDALPVKEAGAPEVM